jgi:hypothetical protein
MFNDFFDYCRSDIHTTCLYEGRLRHRFAEQPRQDPVSANFLVLKRVGVIKKDLQDSGNKASPINRQNEQRFYAELAAHRRLNSSIRGCVLNAQYLGAFFVWSRGAEGSHDAPANKRGSAAASGCIDQLIPIQAAHANPAGIGHPAGALGDEMRGSVQVQMARAD